MQRVVTVAVCCLLLLAGASRLVHPQIQLFPLEQERAQARHLFEELLRVAALPAGLEVSFSVLESADLIAAYFEQGCYAMVQRDGHLIEAFQTPAISISLAALMLDSGRDVAEVTAFLLAHEVGHLQKRLARKVSCLDEPATTPAERRHEEFDADRRGVQLLNALGYDGARIARDVLTRLCHRAWYGCTATLATHPSFQDRIQAIGDDPAPAGRVAADEGPDRQVQVDRPRPPEEVGQVR
jgi:Zn-dependent protease with chaperone function